MLERAGGATAAVEKASIDEVYVDVTLAAQALLSSLKDGDGAQENRVKQQQQQPHDGEGKAGKEAADEKGGSKPLSAPPEEEEGRNRGPRRWEEIGKGGWAAVVLEAATTHVRAVGTCLACCYPSGLAFDSLFVLVFTPP